MNESNFNNKTIQKPFVFITLGLLNSLAIEFFLNNRLQ